MSRAALEKLKNTYFGRILHAPSHGYVMGDVPVAALAEVVRDYEVALARIAELENERDDLQAELYEATNG